MDRLRRKPPMEGYSRPGQLGGEAINDDEVEGHIMTDDFTQTDEDTEGHRKSLGRVADDDDTEGHRKSLGRVADDDDTEGHSSSKKQ